MAYKNVTVTMPHELYDEAKKAGVEFSKLLREAIQKELTLHKKIICNWCGLEKPINELETVEYEGQQYNMCRSCKVNLNYNN